MTQWLSPLPPPSAGSWEREQLDDRALLAAIENATAPELAQVRNRALLLMGYGAALRVQEAVGLNQGDVVVHRDGLVISPRRRRHSVALLRDRQPEFCPVRAWHAWSDLLARAGMVDAERPAFVRIRGRGLVDHRLSREGLSRAVRLPCAEVGLHGDYGFLGLRAGFIRTSVRDDYAEFRIASQADLASLRSVDYHGRREQIFRDNVAAQLGL
jgi:integrase